MKQDIISYTKGLMILQVKKAPSPFPFILSRAVNEAVQTALDREHVNDQKNNFIIRYLYAHIIFLNGQGQVIIMHNVFNDDYFL